MMTEVANHQESKEIRANELLRAGRVAYAQGERRRAHDLWRQAAALRPHDEQIWLSLLSVVSDSQDRRVCLQNILTINPNNKQAARQLRTMNFLEAVDDSDVIPEEARRPGFLRRLWLAFLNVLKTIYWVVIVSVLSALGVLIIRVLSS